MKKIVKKLESFLLSVGYPTTRSAFPKSDRINIDNSFSIGRYKNISISKNASISIRGNVSFREFSNILIYDDGELLIEKNVFFNNYCSINCLGKIRIGENTLFGEGVKIYDHNHLFAYLNSGALGVERTKFSIGSVKIGKNCWIGSNVTILNNVEIGDNVIIGANCLIYKSVATNSVVKHKEELL